MKNYKAVLFDFDGTLASTMQDHFRSWQFVFKEFGADIFPDDYFPLEGNEVPRIAEILCEKYEISTSLAYKIAKLKDENYLSNLRGGLVEFYPGVENIICDLGKRNVLLGIVTGGFADRIQKSVSPEILKLFTAMVTAETTERGKPFADPYLKGAELVGVDPKDCVGVENAPLGVKSVKSAGMYCVALAHTVSADKLSEADVILPAFEELSEFFENIGV